jgi:hypothetical protein
MLLKIINPSLLTLRQKVSGFSDPPAEKRNKYGALAQDQRTAAN